MSRRIAIVFGTRPEAIKLAPVVHALRLRPWAEVLLVSTAQHRELADTMCRWFGMVPDVDLNLMQPNQSVPQLLARATERLHATLHELLPDCVIAQGDTTTVLATALACQGLNLPLAHVEAGLRTGDPRDPYPEETNRIQTGRIAALHFAPTPRARDNLLKEGIAPASIFVTGNTAIDALQWTIAHSPPTAWQVPPGKRLLLVTAHRREAFGAGLLELCAALRELAARSDVQILFPVHPNPNVREVVQRELADCACLTLREPLDYPDMVAALRACHVVLTDSGGIQEEAPSLGKPVLVLRAATERPEAVAAGLARVVGLQRERIVAAATQLLDDADVYHRMAQAAPIFGDGHAATRIADALAAFLNEPGAKHE